MIPALCEAMKIPESCYLGKRVYKKLFRENAKLNATDKKALRDDVDTIIWQYTFKPATIPIQSYEDDQREYHEVALLQINLKQTGRVNRLAEIIHRAIPYPLIVVFVSDTTCSISLAHKRFSQAEKEAIVAEGFQATGWLDLSNLTKSKGAFLESLDISTWPQKNFFAFYSAAMDRVIALKCAEQSGQYSLELPNGLTVDDRARKLSQVEKLRQERSGILNQIKNEKNLGTQVQMNTQIKNITDLIKKITSEL